MPETKDRAAALEALAGGDTLVTGNARLARRYLGDEALARRAAGESVWRRGDALSWDAWLRRLHTDALAAGAIRANEPAIALTPAQAETVWQQVIEADLADSQPLLQPAAAARQAREAHELCLAWRIAPETIAGAHPHDDAAAFLRWWRAFAQRLEIEQWLAPGELADRAAGWLAREPSIRPKALWLAGFQEFTPQQEALLSSIESLGMPVQYVPFAQADGDTAAQARCPDAEAEADAAAQWARRRLEANPAARLAIVVPDIEERRAHLARRLDAALDPPAARDPGRRRQRPWNISLGTPLADEPLVHDALLILRAASGRLDFTGASRLLRSPFLGGAETERAARMHAEVLLREIGDVTVRTEWLARLLREPPRRHARAASPDLARRLEDLRELAGQAPREQSPARWAEHFAKLLRAAGWPGERTLDSHEHQALDKWHELLGELTRTGTVLPRLDRAGALSRLRRLAAEAVFQPKSPPAPVQVLGLFQAIGHDFDGLWVMGLDDENWPASPRPNPFLPVALQRKHGLPHADAQRERRFAESLTRHLFAAAPEVIASWPERTEDRSLRPSPLIAHLPEHELETASVPDPRRALLGTAELELLDETHGPALQDAATLYRRGKDVFVNQSKCPFKAFAVHRLGAEALDSPAPGLDARERGILVHAILENLWRELKTRQALVDLDRASRERLVRETVTAAMERARARTPALFAERFAEVEQRRLEALVAEWLARELERPEFTVQAPERDVELTINGLTVNMRMDRVDELPGGGVVLIDYKTGDAKPKDWLPERDHRAPDPQLPVYATRFGDELQGMLFGQVKAHQCAWRGVVRTDLDIPGAAVAGHWPGKNGPPWQELRAQWQAMAETLAAEVTAGLATVDPLKDACKYCHLAALCRVDELQGGFARGLAEGTGDE